MIQMIHYKQSHKKYVWGEQEIGRYNLRDYREFWKNKNVD